MGNDIFICHECKHRKEGCIPRVFGCGAFEEEKKDEKEENNLSCFDCKHHFMSDCYLECYKHNRINDSKICDDFEKEQKQ